ncbi:MAG: AAA family ATPase [Kaiparowitsia implicata GSE-PSE-MK54-09C]|jgi:chromosome partitioning protein|nr:AAA family ATPase [Kaiparowitsia implicata GSE-PSE-MK54-09C]
MITAIANQKGGVAKTTSSLALAGLLADEGTCLAVDLDPQGNLTTGFGIELAPEQSTVYEVLTGVLSVKGAIAPTRSGVALLPGDISLAKIEKELMTQPHRFYTLKKVLNPVLAEYEQVVIDCPPSLGLLTINALAAADVLLVPVQCQFFALKGLQGLLETIHTVRQRLNPTLRILGVLPTMAETHTVITQETMKILRSQLQDIRVFDPVPKSVKFPESNMAGEPIHRYVRDWKLVQPYREVVRELLMLEK